MNGVGKQAKAYVSPLHTKAMTYIYKVPDQVLEKTWI